MKLKPTYQELENKIKELEKINISQLNTNNKKQENTKESDSNYKSLFENMTDAFALHRIVQDDQNKVIDYVFIETNKEFELQTGLKRDKILNKKVTEVILGIENDPGNWIEIYGKVVISGVPLKFEQFSEPLQKWYSVLVYSPKEKHFATIFRDITNLKKIELEIKKQNIELEHQGMFINTLLDNLKVGVVACDAEGKLTYFNKTTQEFHGLPQKEISSEHWAKYYDLYFPDGKTKMQTKDIPLFRALEGEQFNDIEMMIIPKQGKSYTLAASGSTIFDSNEKKQGAVVSMYDISERKLVEQALKESKQKLNIANETKDKFFSIIAHDLKSPFNSMLGFSKILNENFDKYSTEEKKRFIGIIYDGLQNTLKLLENLLQWSHSQMGGISFNYEKINLYLKAQEICDLLKQSAENKSIKLINQLTLDIYVDADTDMLATIIRNLLSNAIKYTRKNGKITIKTFLVPEDNNIQYVGISVTDTGVGIPKEIQSSIFDISENSSTKGTENEKGTGLGLILCKEFVEKHGGKIWMESEIDKGSTFYFTIPNG